MLSLNIETSSNLTSVSLSQELEILEILNINSETPNHCELLAPLIRKLLDKALSTFDHISEVRVNIGPGNLSSLRVGIATANTIGSIKKIPVYGISSFLLYGFSYKGNFDSLMTLFDLKNNMFAYGKFKKIDNNIKLYEENSKITFEELESVDFEDSVIIGTGAKKLQSLYSDRRAGLNYDSNYNIDSSSLAKVDLKEPENHIFTRSPLMPFNSFSFVS